MLSTLGGLVALVGDLIWLATDAIFEPYMHLPKAPFFLLIGCCFAAAITLLIVDLLRHK
jgi:hypothetical protein